MAAIARGDEVSMDPRAAGGVRARAILWISFAYAGLCALATLAYPMGRDQGIYAWAGEIVLRGGRPYRDAWEVKGPLTFLMYGAAHALFGRNMWGIRVIDLCMLTLGALAIRAIVRRFGHSLAASLAMLLCIFVYLRAGWWHMAEPDGWATLLALAAIAVVAKPRSGRRPEIAAGVIVGLGALTKTIFGLFLIPVALYPMLHEAGSPVRRAARCLPTVLAFLATLGVGVAWLAWRGGLREAIEIQLHFNPRFHHPQALSPAVAMTALTVHQFRPVAILMQLLLAPLGMVAGMRQRRPLALSLLALLCAALVILLVQWKFWPYHWLPLVLPLTAFTALGGAELARRLAPRLPRPARVAAVLLVVPFVWVLARPPRDAVHALRGLAAHLPAARVYGDFRYPDYSTAAILECAEYIARRTSPDEYVLAWSYDPVINYLSARRSPTSLGYDYPLVATRGTSLGDAYRRRYLADLQAHTPSYVVIADHDSNLLLARTSKELLLEFPEIASFIARHYVLETTIEHLELWKRRSSS